MAYRQVRKQAEHVVYLAVLLLVRKHMGNTIKRRNHVDKV